MALGACQPFQLLEELIRAEELVGGEQADDVVTGDASTQARVLLDAPSRIRRPRVSGTAPSAIDVIDDTKRAMRKLSGKRAELQQRRLQRSRRYMDSKSLHTGVMQVRAVLRVGGSASPHSKTRLCPASGSAEMTFSGRSARI